jgi:CRP/FNR family transcriptional regulator, cyclic AMP receptor protein
MDTHWIELIGFGGTAMTVASYSMRTIIPLRIAGIASSFFFIAYGVMISSWPMLLMEFTILPLNIVRLLQLMRLLKQVEGASGGEFDIAWLQPFAHHVRRKAGDTLFREGDSADHLLIVHSGKFGLAGRDVTFGPGDMMGELGFISPENHRTATLLCLEDGEVGRVSYADLKQLFFQNPKFGYFLLKLIARRMFENEARARATAPMAIAAE